MKIVIPFEGFYETIHTDSIDNAETQAMDFEGHGDIWDGISREELTEIQNATNWRKAYEEYARLYAQGFNKVLKEDYGIDLNLSFSSLESPHFYNFETDRIFCEISLENVTKLRSEVSQGILANVLQARCADRSGFISYYTTDVLQWLEKADDALDHNELYIYLLAYLAGYENSDVTEAENKIMEDVFNRIHDSSPTASDTAYDIAISGKAAELINAAYEKYENNT